MPFTALKRIYCQISTNEVIVMRRLMPFTALKHLQHNNKETNKPPVVRRLMPFTALKLFWPKKVMDFSPNCCAPPNAVYGIETL